LRIINGVVTRVTKELEQPKLDEVLVKAGILLAGLVQEDAYVGDVYSCAR
jgi:hypothetical protein